MRLETTNVVQLGSAAKTSMPNATIAMSMTNIARVIWPNDVRSRPECRNQATIAGGFRFGTAGAFAAAGALSLAYLGIAAYRADTYGFVIDPPRPAFHV